MGRLPQTRTIGILSAGGHFDLDYGPAAGLCGQAGNFATFRKPLIPRRLWTRRRSKIRLGFAWSTDCPAGVT